MARLTALAVRQPVSSGKGRRCWTAGRPPAARSRPPPGCRLSSRRRAAARGGPPRRDLARPGWLHRSPKSPDHADLLVNVVAGALRHFVRSSVAGGVACLNGVEESAESGVELVDGGSGGWVGLEGRVDGGAERAGQAAGPVLQGWRAAAQLQVAVLLIEEGVLRLVQRCERWLPRGGLIQGGADSPDIGRRGQVVTQGLFGGHVVAGGAAPPSRARGGRQAG